MGMKQRKKPEPMQLTEEQIFAKARELGDEWLSTFDVTGDYSLDAIEAALQNRTGPNGEDVKIYVARDPAQAVELLNVGAAENRGTLTDEEVATELSNAHNCVWDYYWMAFYESAAQAAGIDNYMTNQTLLPAFQVGLGYLINMGNFMVAVARPEAHLDPDRELHSETGPAVVWGDSIKQYFWHGTEIPSEFIEDKEHLTAAVALGQDNQELRRCACEILGWANILRELDARTIDKHPDPEIGTLVAVDLPESPNEKFLLVKCGTGRDFAIPMPEHVKTAIEAQHEIYPHIPIEAFEKRQARA